MFVALGLGSVVASAVTIVPWLAIVSRQKGLVFGVSAGMLALNYWLVVVRPRKCAPGEICHADSRAMRLNRRVFWFSLFVYVTAAALTFGALAVVPV